MCHVYRSHLELVREKRLDSKLYHYVTRFIYRSRTINSIDREIVIRSRYDLYDDWWSGHFQTILSLSTFPLVPPLDSIKPEWERRSI